MPKNIVIFGPNGVGKSSIAKTFQQIIDSEIKGFGYEGDGYENSLILNGENMKDLQKRKLLVLTNDDLHVDKMTHDPIKNNLDNNNWIGKTFKNIFSPFNDLITKIQKEDYFKFKKTPKKSKLNILSKFRKIGKNPKQIQLGRINELTKLSKDKTFRKIGEIKENLKFFYENYNLIMEMKEIIQKVNKNLNNDKSQVAKKRKKMILNDIFKIFNGVLSKDKKPKYMQDFLSYILNINYYENQNIQQFREAPKTYNKIKKQLLKIRLNNDEIKCFAKGYRAMTINEWNPDFGEFGKKIKKLEIEYLKSILQNNDLISIKESIDDDLEEYKIEYNKYILKINGFLKNREERIWSFKLKEIKTAFDKVEFIYKQNQDKRDLEKFKNFGSIGQLKIIAIVLKLLDHEKYDYIVIDDIINSFDIDNVDLVIDIILSLKSSIILLTHNFALLNKIAFNDYFTAKFNLSILDFIKEKTYLILGIKWKQIENISHLLKEKNKINALEISRLSMLSSVLYEYINNFIGFDRKRLKPATSNSSKYFQSINDTINFFSRHWKNTDKAISFFSEELREPSELHDKKKQIENYSDILFNEYSIFHELLGIEKDESFLNYFINFSSNNIINQVEPMSLIDWISLKYKITMSIRYKIEEFIVTKDPKLKKLWCIKNSELGELSFNKITKYTKMNGYLEDEDNKKLVEYLLDINRRLNFINHLDNLKWSPLFEFPTLKLIKLLDLVVNKIEAKNKTHI